MAVLKKKKKTYEKESLTVDSLPVHIIKNAKESVFPFLGSHELSSLIVWDIVIHICHFSFAHPSNQTS